MRPLGEYRKAAIYGASAVPTAFAYPYGAFNPAVMQTVVDMGYDVAFSTGRGVQDPAMQRYAIPRR